MLDSYIKLGLAALLPTVATVALYLLDEHTAFGKCKNVYKQLAFGVVFGVLAIMGTDFGVPINNAQMNCRDAAVLCAGLFFGAPAGIIAGIIGGVERWFSVYWGISAYTRLACSVSTIIAGFYAAALRKFMFENRRCGSFISLAIGVVMEVFHMTMVFITHMDAPIEAMAIVKTCSIVMIPANAISVWLAAFALMLVSRKRGKTKKKHISQIIQRWLLLTVVVAFLVTTTFIYRLQDELANAQSDKLLSLSLDEVSNDISDASDANLLNTTYAIQKALGTDTLENLAKKYNVVEISLVDENGIIVDSNNPHYVGFDMKRGEQSAEFMCLLGDTEEFVQDYGPTARDANTFRKYAAIKAEPGFMEVGYDEAALQHEVDTQVVGITRNRHVGQTGYVMILDSQLNIKSAPPALSQKNLTQAADNVSLPGTDTNFNMVINGVECLCRYTNSEGYYIFSVLPIEEALQMRNIALYINTFMEILVFAILFAIIYVLIKRVIVLNLKSVNKSLGKIASGDLDENVNVRSSVEFSSLSDDINTTVDTLKHYISEASARIDQELEFAKNIQTSALPSNFPAFPKRHDLDIYASMDPAKSVGGDFYDFYITHEDTLNFLIADVSGKGIPAAMFMMRAKTELKSLTEADMPLSTVFTHGNDALCEGNDAGMFVTAWQGSIDLTTGKVQFANAGHNPPLVRRKDGKFEYLRSRAGLVLAGMEGFPYKAQELQLERGDVIYLYTDGVTEATNASNELYGEERLIEAINSREFADMQELCKFIKSDVDAFVGEAPQFDDITMVALQYIGTPPAPFIHFDEAEISDINAVTEFIETELEKVDCPMKTIVQLNVAVDELYSNIVRYGYPNEKGPVTVTLIHHEDPNRVYIRFCDEGIPYNPLTKEDPDITLSAEDRKIGGLGIFIVKKTMDEMKYKYEDGQNILTVMKLL